MKCRYILFVVFLSASMLFDGGAAFAQRDAGSKIRGDAYNVWTGSTYQGNAVQHARILNQYSATGEPVPKNVIQEQSQAIRSNLEGAQRAYSKLSESAKKDKEAAKHLAEIEEHHAMALKMCDMLDGLCVKPEGDSAIVCKCCSEMEKELKAAEAAHEKLMQQLKIEKPGVPAPRK